MEPDRTEDDNTPSPVDRLIAAVRELEAKPDFPDIKREFDNAKADVEALMVGQAALLPVEARREVVQQLARSLNLRISPLIDLGGWALQAVAGVVPENVDPADYISRLNNLELLNLISNGLNAHDL